MKPGRKKTEKDEAGSRKPEPEAPGSRRTGADEPGPFNVDSNMIGGNPEGIDGVRALQLIAGGIIALLLIWVVLRYVLHII